MIVKFNPHQDFLVPFQDVAAKHNYITDQYFERLDHYLEQAGFYRFEVLCTRLASERIDPVIPFKLKADFDERMQGADVLIEIAEEL